ncbi:MAG: transposase [Candidatus Zixiibacteriota bacterium]
MKSLRRYVLSDATFFVTAVSYERRPILLREPELFQKAWRGRELDAWVILPDHFHAVLTIGKVSISQIMHDFKLSFSRRYRLLHGPGRVWQNRFWDHVVRDQEDLNKRIDYIRYNPVRHGLALDPFAYSMSSAARWLERGYYQRDWGVRKPISFDGSFGE